MLAESLRVFFFFSLFIYFQFKNSVFIQEKFEVSAKNYLPIFAHQRRWNTDRHTENKLPRAEFRQPPYVELNRHELNKFYR